MKAKVREYGALMEYYGRDKTDVPYSENILSQYSSRYKSHNTVPRSDRYSLHTQTKIQFLPYRVDGAIPL